jgi:1,4-alpha-glucan branching enzyme
MENPDNAAMLRLIHDLNAVYRDSPALWSLDTDPAGFSWIDANDATGNVFSFIRHGSDGTALVCVANFAGMPHENYRLGLPEAGVWREVINTDLTVYAGSGVDNGGAVTADKTSWHGQPASAVLRVPPLGAIWLQL